MSNPEYPYSKGERLEERNTYFYSEYHGVEFFSAWRTTRKNALAGLPAPCKPAVSNVDAGSAEGYETFALLGHLLNAQPASADDRKLAERLLQRFEVSKRIYRHYTADFKAVIDSGYDALELYPLFCSMCLHYADQPSALPFLNGLLKCVDTLIAIRDQLSPELAAQLAWLIDEESSWVERVAIKAGVDINQ